MFEISVCLHFCGAHRLPEHAGACRNPHGHNWEVEIFLRGEQTDKVGVLADFGHVKTLAGAVLQELDHHDLNVLPAFADAPPTSEHIARFIFRRLAADLDTGRCRLHRVRVSETPGTSATYWE
ncbi:MAG: 6-pyruvoyl tetrahydropterin synthase family protein [Kiritimatiellia bacterium]|nr:6-carboxytetrahydropterin synthase [Lentisphaerota bacterium]